MSDTPTVIVVEADGSVTLTEDGGVRSIDIDVTMGSEVEVIDIAPFGPMGTPIVPVPYYSWPPIEPQANTLYLRLAP